MTDLSEHPANDVLAPLVQGYFHQAALRRGVHDPEAIHSGRTVLQVDPGAQPPADVAARNPLDRGEVDLHDLEGRMHQAMRQVSVVGEQEQSLAVGVETADMKQTLAVCDQVPHGPAPPRVRHRAQDAPWLVQRQVLEVVPDLDPRAVNSDHGRLRVDSRTKLGNERTVYLDPPCADQEFTRAPRAKARGGQNLLQTHTFVRHVSPST